MAGWSDAILLNQGQGATVRALVASSAGMSVTISVDHPPIQIVSTWDGNTFQSEYTGENHISGCAVSVGYDEVSYLLNYVADTADLSTVDIAAQVKEASISLTEG